MTPTPINGTPDPAPQPPRPPVVIEGYDYALIGHTVAHNATPRFVYSLVLLTEHEQKRQMLVSVDDARRSVWNLVQRITEQHGDRAPLFVDDAATRVEKSRIISPFSR